MRVVILGCGRVGSTLARELDAEGHEVTVIDRNQQQFQRLGPDFGGVTVRGTGIDEDVLLRAGIEEADVFVAMTNGDNTSIMASQIVQEVFEVPHVVTRIYDPVREQLYRSLGLDTICPTTLIAGMVQKKLVDRASGTSREGAG
ncbi:MAG: TrkA family potassium uptake protein [Chloroflexota bacterium]|nr:TrkA family potassium uptake protein [Chloroflexota bacterium]